MMNNKTYRLNNNLVNIYDDVRSEIGFGLSLFSLTEDVNIWETDIASRLKEACQHLFRAQSRVITDTEKTGQILLAELYIRDLVEHLNDELAEFPAQNNGTDQTKLSKSDRKRLEQETVKDPVTFVVATGNNIHHCDFSRNTTTIEVAVDHFSDTNFFSDISDDMRSIGLFVATYNILEVGTPLNVRIVLPGKTSFEMLGNVSWVREPANCAEDVSPGMGIALEELDKGIRGKIQRFMSERPPLLFEVA